MGTKSKLVGLATFFLFLPFIWFAVLLLLYRLYGTKYENIAGNTQAIFSLVCFIAYIVLGILLMALSDNDNDKEVKKKSKFTGNQILVSIVVIGLVISLIVAELDLRYFTDPYEKSAAVVGGICFLFFSTYIAPIAAAYYVAHNNY